MDFTLKSYESILKAIKTADIPIYTVEKWIRQAGKRGVILRHDVDRLPGNALDMATLEADYDIQSTYYFRIGKHTFKPSIIQQIAEMGHEIGYHYEDLSLANGDYEKAYSFFKDHLAALRKYATIETIAMHGRPLSQYDNRDLWKRYDFKDLGIIGEAFLSIDYSDIYYFTDTGRSWSDSAMNLRDKVERGLMAKNVVSSADLSEFITKNNLENLKIGIVAHPERWNDSMIKWLMYLGFDETVNIIKYILTRGNK